MSTGDNAKVGLGSSFKIGFQRYTSVMAWFDLAAMTASLSVLMLYFRRSIPSRYELAQLKPQHEAIRDMGTFRTGWAVLALLVFGFFGLEPLGVRVSAVAAVVGDEQFACRARGRAVEAASQAQSAFSCCANWCSTR